MKRNQFFLIFIFLFLFLFSLTGIVQTAETNENGTSKKGISILEAIHTTISLQPYIQIQQEEVNKNKGNFRSSQGQFNWKITSSLSYKDEITPLTSAQKIVTGKNKSDKGITSYQLGFSKKLRTGITLNPYLSLVRTDDENFNTLTTNEASINFSIIVPLLKGWGKDVAGAEEKATELLMEATHKDLQHTISSYVLKTIVAYWSYVAAHNQLDIYKNSELRAQKFLADIKNLVSGGERPASDIAQAKANLAAKISERISSEQNLIEAKYNLGLATGKPVKEINALPLPSDALPVPGEPKFFSAEEYHRLITAALQHRADIKAAGKRKKSALVLLEAARKNTKPTLNLNLDTSYAGLKEGDPLGDMAHAFNSNVKGLNYGIMLTYNYPIGNDFSKGQLRTQKSIYYQTVIQLNDLKRHIISNVTVAMKNLYNSMRKVKKAREAVNFYRKAVKNEREKMKIGMSTVLDVVNMENLYNTARLGEVISRQDYADALANLRYATGLLLTQHKGMASINKKEIMTFPSL